MCDLSDIKNFACATKEEQKKFLCSFDHVLSDMDGVIWITFKPFQGAPECISKLKQLGKSVNFITNNTTVRTEVIYQFLKQFKFPASKENIINPTIGYIHYLRSLNFNKSIFVIGGQGLKDDLTEAGFKLASNSADPIEESMSALLETIVDNEEVGAVIIDFDINLTLLKLQKCLTYLKRKDCLFIVGTGDKFLPFPQNGPLIGNYYFQECLKELSNRKPFQMSKPSLDFNEFIVERLSITNPSRVLFIGDSINEDMKFAAAGGYKKLLVLTGSTKKENVLRWTYEADSKPDYYVESIGALNLILGMLKIN